MANIYQTQYEESLLRQALFELRSAKTIEEVKNVQYEFWKRGIGNTNLVTHLAIYKKYQLNGSDKETLKQCVKMFKIPTKYVKEIA